MYILTILQCITIKHQQYWPDGYLKMFFLRMFYCLDSSRALSSRNADSVEIVSQTLSINTPYIFSHPSKRPYQMQVT